MWGWAMEWQFPGKVTSAWDIRAISEAYIMASALLQLLKSSYESEFSSIFFFTGRKESVR